MPEVLVFSLARIGKIAALRLQTMATTMTHLDTDFVGLFMSLLEDEVNHLSDLIGSGHGCRVFVDDYKKTKIKRERYNVNV